MKYEQDNATIYNDTKLIRRRFYLSKESMNYINQLTIEQQVPPSVLLDEILKKLAEKRRG